MDGASRPCRCTSTRAACGPASPRVAPAPAAGTARPGPDRRRLRRDAAAAERRGRPDRAGERARRCRADRRWPFTPAVAAGARSRPGTLLGTVPETAAIEFRVLVPAGVSGSSSGSHRRAESRSPTRSRGSPARVTARCSAGPSGARVRPPSACPRAPLTTGQRALDLFYPDRATAAAPRSPAASAPARPSSCSRSPSGATPT